MRATLLRLLAPITIKSAARLAANPYKPRRTDGALDPRNLGGDLRFVSQPLETLQPEPLSNTDQRKAPSNPIGQYPMAACSSGRRAAGCVGNQRHRRWAVLLTESPVVSVPAPTLELCEKNGSASIRRDDPCC